MKLRIALLLLLSALSSRWLAAQVPAGGEFQVNTYTTDAQFSAALASDPAGNFIVAWSSRQQDGNLNGVFAQRYDASGLRRGSEFRVNTHTASEQRWPAVAVDITGDFVVVWQSDGQDGSRFGIFAQRYDDSGLPRGSEFRVNTYTTGYQEHASVAADAAGNFVVVWDSYGQDGSRYGVFAQRYRSSGSPLGAEFRVNTYTPDGQGWPFVASTAAGDFVVVWTSLGQDESSQGVFGQLYDRSGAPRGFEFRVNTYTPLGQRTGAVAFDAAGHFVVAWTSTYQDGNGDGVFAQRFDPGGTPLGPEFQVNSETSSLQFAPFVAWDPAGNFVVAWTSAWQDGDRNGVFAQRYDASGAPRGAEFQVNTFTTSWQAWSPVASDAAGNFVVAWESRGPDGSLDAIVAQRFGGIVPAALAIDTAPSGGSDGNRVLEPGESVDMRPSWRNVNGVAQTFDGSVLSFSGPAASGVSYQLLDEVGAYGTVPNGATAPCSDCYQVGVTFGGTRPSLHWDATLTERLTPDTLGQTKPWSIHVGQSFTDVPKTSPYYRFVETLLHKGVTAGCATGIYCPASSTTREQMAAFVLLAREGAGYVPAACSPPNLFADVPETSIFCDVIEELAHRGVVSGCGGGNYCPGAAVSREQMPVFVLRLLDPALDPPACTTPVFADVPASSPFCRWIEELARRGVVGGCGGGNYCPTAPVTREQMAVFVSVTYGLNLYGP